MKKHLVVLVIIMVGFTLVKAHAQPGSSPRPDFDGAMTKLFGDNTKFSATMEFHVSRPSGDEIIMPGKIAVLEKASRFDMDILNMQGAHLPPQAVEQMKQMGMGRMATITRRDKKLCYIIYPDMKAYVEVASQASSAEPSEYKAEVTKLGDEGIEGHDCIKNKVVVTGPDGVAHESTVWNAADLKQFPVKIQTKSEKGMAMVMLFKDVKLGKPDAAQFEVPTDFTKYDNMMNMMMSRAKAAPPQ